MEMAQSVVSAGLSVSDILGLIPMPRGVCLNSSS